MNTEYLYGLNSCDLETAKILIEETLGITLETRISSYRGGNYYSKRLENGDEIVLQINNDNDGEEGSWAEEDHKNFGVLLRLSSPSGADGSRKALGSLGHKFVLLEDDHGGNVLDHQGNLLIPQS